MNPWFRFLRMVAKSWDSLQRVIPTTLNPDFTLKSTGWQLTDVNWLVATRKASSSALTGTVGKIFVSDVFQKFWLVTHVWLDPDWETRIERHDCKFDSQAALWFSRTCLKHKPKKGNLVLIQRNPDCWWKNTWTWDIHGRNPAGQTSWRNPAGQTS